MNWHYAENNSSKGPIPEAAFLSLVRAGRVTPETLVWHEGMPQWIPLSEAAPELLTAAASAEPAATEGVTVQEAGEDWIKCAECGGQFPRSQAVGLPGGWVCAACKPIRIQKLKEGAAGGGALAGTLPYAGFWIRFAAKFVDGLIMVVILLPIMIPLVLMMVRGAQEPDNPAGLLMQLAFNCGQIIISLSYNTFFIGKYGATPGKMICGIKVVSPDGAKITYGRALGRAAAEILSGMICYIGYIIAGFDREKRSLHDHIATTRVIYGPKF